MYWIRSTRRRWDFLQKHASHHHSFCLEPCEPYSTFSSASLAATEVLFPWQAFKMRPWQVLQLLQLAQLNPGIKDHLCQQDLNFFSHPLFSFLCIFPFVFLPFHSFLLHKTNHSPSFFAELFSQLYVQNPASIYIVCHFLFSACYFMLFILNLYPYFLSDF